MKGMSKILRGYTFKSVLLYCEGRGDKDAADGRLVGGNMAGRTVAELMSEFLVTRRQRPDIEKTTWHNSLRLPFGDEISDEKWDLIAGDYMKKMGFEPLHPYCIWKHDDESAIHIVASRIAMDGSVYLGKNENLVSTRIIQELEREHHLQITKGPEHDENGKLVMPDTRKLTRKEYERAYRTEDEPPKQALQNLVREAVKNAPTVVQFAERLTAAGVSVIANLATTGTFSGFSFGFEGISFKGSQLGKLFSWKGLQEQGVTYEQDRDREKLGQYRAAARADSDSCGAANDDRVSVQPASIEQRADAQSDQNVGRGSRSGVRAEVDSDRSIDGRSTQNAGILEGDGVGNTDRESAADIRSSCFDRVDLTDLSEDSRATNRHGRAIDQDRVIRGEGNNGASAVERSQRQESSAHAGQQLGDVAIAGKSMGKQAADVREVLSADHQKKIEAWRRQASALGAPTYRVSLIGRTGQAEGKRINLGKSRDEDGAEHFYDAAAVEALIPQLRRRNALGFDVYVTPIDSVHHYIVIDDMKPGAAQLLAGLGHAPCIVQSSSKDNEQAVLKVPRLDRPDEQALANKVVQQLNMAHGDPKFSGVVHPFRMAAFSNKKPGRGSAFTRILEAVPRLCLKASNLLQQLRQAADDLVDRARKKREQEQIEVDANRQTQRNWDRSEIELDFDRSDDPERGFRRAAAGVRAWVRLRGLIEYDSRVDFRAAVAMLRAGWSEAQVRAGMVSGSDGLAARHSDPHDYARRTVSKAGVELSTSRQASEASALPRPRGV
jgi:hypothetical protein